MAVEAYTVPEDAEGQRVDAWLASVSGRSRSRIQMLLDGGHIRLADGSALHASRRITAGMAFEIEEPPPASVGIVAQDIPLSIVYEDADLIVLDKPTGLVVHPAPGHDDGTLVNALLHHCGGALPVINGEERPGIVHRLDQYTSGLLVVAKTDAALRGMVEQFQSGGVHKTYVALVHGVPRPASGHVETLIGRSPTDRKKMAVVERNGREAVTDFRTVGIFLQSDMALLEVTIATGRTHQIRVHMKHIGHPVAGDPVYGNPRRDNALGIPRGRQFLHARYLSFAHPVTGEALSFEAPLPEDFEAILRQVRTA